MPEGGRPESVTALGPIALRALAQLVPPDSDSPELCWLSPLSEPGFDPAWVARARRAAEGEHRALLRVAASLRLTDGELLVCALVLAAELEVRVARAVATLQGVAARPGPALPTLGLLARVAVTCGLLPLREDARAVSALLGGAAFASGLLQLAREGRGAAEGTVAMPLALVAALGAAGDRRAQGADFGAVSAIPVRPPAWSLPPALARSLAEIATEISDRAASVVTVRAPSLDEAKPVAALLAQEIGRLPIELCGFAGSPQGHAPARPPGGLEPWLTVVEGVPIIALDAAPGEVWTLPRFDWYGGPVLVAAGQEGELDCGGSSRLEFQVAWPTIAERAGVLRARLNGAAARLDEGRIERLARRSRVGLAALHGIAEAVERAGCDIGLDAAVSAIAARGARSLAPLALPIATRISDAAFVIPAGLRRDMQLLLARCEERETLTESLGPAFSARYSPGVKALFVGASGTGKTLAAQWLAMRLGKPLFRVDLSAVSSKYIGETEKNLAQLLARAEGLDAVLLFDEADSLFGARTEVKQANDRFANAQTNYLLARIESFEGTALLTSNSQERFDHAFLRRLDGVIEFPLPSASERRELWDVHLGTGHALTASQLNRLAAEVDFAGGHIRNIVLSAALLARARAVPLIDWHDVVNACSVEYAKLGRRPPDGLVLSGS